MKYTVMRAYSSAWGTLVRGHEVDLDDATAEWLLRDAPGVIEPAEKPKPKARAVREPPKTRQVKAAPKDRGAEEDDE